MKKNLTTSAAQPSRLRGKGLAALLSVALLATPATALASTALAGAPEVAAEGIATEGATLVADEAASAAAQGDAIAAVPSAPEEAPAPESAASEPAEPASAEGEAEGTHTMTFYHCEIVYYDDDFDHPTGMRLMDTEVVTGLHEGDVLDTWDYVRDFDGHYFFDAWPARPVVTADDSANVVELHYFRTSSNTCTVNYYHVAALQDEAPAAEERDVIHTSQATFTKMGSSQLENLVFGTEVSGASLADPVEGMSFLASYPAQLNVASDADENVLNLIYYGTMSTLPDDLPIDEQPVADAPGAPDAGQPPAAGEGSPTAPGSSSPDAPLVQTGMGGAASTAEQASGEAASLAQTGDGAGLALAGLAGGALAGAAALALMRRRQRSEGSSS